MNKTSGISLLSGAVLLCALLAGSPTQAAQNNWPGTKKGESTAAMKNVPPALAKNLATFDDLDFRVYTNQQWQDLHKSHSKDVIVHWPDGHTTQGIEKHIEDLKVMFTFAPDNRILEHPVRFGTADGEWTAVTGWLEGTFTKPMATPRRKVDRADGQGLPYPDGDGRPLGQGRHHVRGVPVLGQRRVHEADRARAVSRSQPGQRIEQRFPNRDWPSSRAIRQSHVSPSEYSPTNGPARGCSSGAIVFRRTLEDRSGRVGPLKG